jgi:hypothetical protein
MARVEVVRGDRVWMLVVEGGRRRDSAVRSKKGGLAAHPFV